MARPAGIFPTFTHVAPDPVTVCERMSAGVFDYPFFNEGVAKSGRGARERLTLDVDAATTPPVGRLALKGFIFHTSHCGSTLLARMLAASPRVRVVSETEAINGLLLAYRLYGLPEEQVLTRLSAILDTYRQPLEAEAFLVFKLTSWNVFFAGLFQRLYPDVGWVYIDRETDAVVRSLLASGGGFADWWHHPVDAIRRHFLGPEAGGGDLHMYLERMVELHRQQAAAARNGKALFLDYPGFLPDLERISTHLALDLSEGELRRAAGVTAFEAKSFEKVRFDAKAR
jgi:hypothetical protein